MAANAVPSIAVIGAGPGGLLLARYLQVHSIQCTVYELEPSRDSRTQGGSLDLHAESGLLATREAGLEDEIQKHLRKEGEQMKIMDKDGNLLLDTGPEDNLVFDKPEGSHRPEIDRTDLRKVLLDSLHEGTIKWGHRVKTVEALDSGYRLTFTDQPTVEVDVLIGADGAWSRVRPLLTPILPVYSGISFYDLSISDVDARFPKLAEIVGGGMNMIAAPGQGITAQRNSNSVVRIYAFLRATETFIEEHPLPADPSEARRFIVSLYEGWSDSILDFITSANNDIVPRKIYALPPTLTWSTNLRGITLIGDAAHVMSPFAGEGVNLALLDAYEVGKELVEALSSNSSNVVEAIDAGLRRYETGMWQRAQEFGKESARNLEMMFSSDAPHSFVKLMKSFGPPPDAQ